MNSVIEKLRRRPVLPELQHLAWSVINTVQFVITLTCTACGIVVALVVLAMTGSRRLPLRMASTVWSPFLLWCSGTKLRVQGLENVDWSQPHLIVANHQSIIDICALFRAIPVPLRFLLKQELGRVPFLGWYARAMGMIFINRDRGRSAQARLDEAVDLVRGGASLCAFPEGTRSRDGSMGRFKSGAFRIAIGAGVPIVPIYIKGSGAVLPAGGFRVRPGLIEIHIGEPVCTHGHQAGQWRPVADQCLEAMIAQKHNALNPTGRTSKNVAESPLQH